MRGLTLILNFRTAYPLMHIVARPVLSIFVVRFLFMRCGIVIFQFQVQTIMQPAAFQRMSHLFALAQHQAIGRRHLSGPLNDRNL